MTALEIQEKILKLKKEKRAIILAHNYQIDQIQDIADYVGDSFGLAQVAAKCTEEIIIFCGVHFMAESAKILAPEKTVILPVQEAGCPLADMAEADDVRKFRAKYPQAAAVAYVNTSAAVKAEIDVCCTSSNAVQVVESLPQDQVIFLPDQNLGAYIDQKTEKEIIIWPGYCITHHRVAKEDVDKARQAHPDALIAVHPECPPEVCELADYVGGTSGILEYVTVSENEKFIIGTEVGMLHPLQQKNPNKRFYLLSPKLICANMKKTKPIHVLQALETLAPAIDVEKQIAQQARQSLIKMLEIS